MRRISTGSLTLIVCLFSDFRSFADSEFPPFSYPPRNVSLRIHRLERGRKDRAIKKDGHVEHPATVFDLSDRVCMKRCQV